MGGEAREGLVPAKRPSQAERPFSQASAQACQERTTVQPGVKSC